MKKLVVFDIAGTTLQDFDVVNNAFTKAFNYYHMFPTKNQIDAVMGMSKPEAIQIILNQIPNPNDFDVKEIHDEFLLNIENHYRFERINEISGASNIFKVLHDRGYKVALDTGFSRRITQLIMEKTGWRRNGLVDGVISSDEVVMGRPAPYMIFRLMEQLGIERTVDVVKVGDTAADIQEGLNASCGLVIGVTSGTYSQEQFRECPGNFFILPNITYVTGLLEKIKRD